MPLSGNASPAIGRWWWLLSLAAGAAIVVGFWWMAHRTLYPLLPDSTAYLEMARSFLRVGRFEVVPYALTESGATSTPTILWPPLFPLTIAALSHVGIADVLAAPLINRCCFAVVPAALLWALAGHLPPRRGLMAGLLALTAPGMLATQYFGLSEGLATLLLVVSVGSALRAERMAMLVVSGVCAGAAYVTRNPALAICVAIPAWLLLERERGTPARLLAWSAGALLAIAPLWWYNVSVFGSVQPYAATASTTGIVRNVQALTVSMAGELVGARGVDQWLAFPVLSLLTCVGFAAGAVWGWRASVRRAHDGRAVRLLLLVAAGMSALLVVAASRYEFQGLGDHRFVVPYLWTLFAAGAVLMPEIASRHLPLVLGSVVLLVGARGYDSWQRSRHMTDHGDGAMAVAADTSLHRYLVDQVEPRVLVASNAAWVLRAETGTATRQLLFCPDFDAQLSQLTALVASGRPVAVVMTAPVTGARCEDAWMQALRQRGFVPVFVSPQSVVYRQDPSPSGHSS